MKKLMFAVAAVAAGVAMADVTSANIVGYAGSDLRDAGATLTSALFMNVSSPDGSLKLSNIVPVKADGDVAGWWEVEIQYLNFDGSTDFDHDYLWNGENWENADMEDMSDVEVPAGQGLFVGNSTGVAVNFRSSGELNQKDVVFTLRDAGATAAGNCFPTTTTLGELLPQIKDSEDVPGWWELEIQYLNFDGSTDFDNDYMWNGENWENADMEDMSELTINPGQGLFIGNSTGKAVTLRIPAPEIK